jgi:hypothetical protein
VAEVRAALGDSPRATRYTRTVHRYGYAFQADARPAPVLDTAHCGFRFAARGAASGFCRKAPILLVEIATVRCGSIRHALVDAPDRCHGTESTLEDLSKNGTLVNGQRTRLSRRTTTKFNSARSGDIPSVRDLPSTLTRQGGLMSYQCVARQTVGGRKVVPSERDGRQRTRAQPRPRRPHRRPTTRCRGSWMERLMALAWRSRMSTSFDHFDVRGDLALSRAACRIAMGAPSARPGMHIVRRDARAASTRVRRSRWG